MTILSFLMIFLGVFYLFKNLKSLKTFKETKILSVSAKCVDFQKSIGYSKGSHYYKAIDSFYPIYEYIINNQKYRFCSNDYAYNSSIGTYKILKINENDPTEVIIETTKNYIFAISIDILSIILGLFILTIIFI